MRHGPALLRVTAAVLWGATIAADAIDAADGRIWLPILAAATLATWAAIQHYLIDQASQSAHAMARAALTRPYDRRDTGPMLKAQTGPLPKLSLLDAPPPAAAPAARHTRRGQHASR